MSIERTMLLTGASRGIGQATAKLFRERGWRVVTVSRQPVAEAGADHIEADLAEIARIDALVAEIGRHLPEGRLHALVNNAGISPKGPGRSRLGVAATGAATWTEVLNVNLVSAALLARGLLPCLRAGSGAIVNVTSIAGARVHPFAGAAYAASKAGLAALTREMAHEFAGDGVRANAVSPGEIETSILSPGTDKLVEALVPAKRLGSPAEVAEAIYFLCSPASAYINGSELPINGGQHV